MIARAREDPAFRESLRRVVRAKEKPTYEAYVERKRREGKPALEREQWERKVFGVPSSTPTSERPAQPTSPGVSWNPRPLFPESETSHLPRWVLQESDDPETLFEESKEAHEQMVHWLDEGRGIDRTIGARVVRRDQDPRAEFDLDTPGPVVVIAPPKSEEAAREKVKTRYGGSWREGAIDLIRATIAVDRYDDLQQVVDALRESGMDLASSPRDRFAKPTDVGYRDIVFNVRMPNGHIVEMQLNLKEILKAKEEAHPYYTKVKNRQKQRHRDGKGPDEKEIEEAARRQRGLYERAWKVVQPSEEIEPYPGMLPKELEEAEKMEEAPKPEKVEDVVSLFTAPDKGKKRKTAGDGEGRRAGRGVLYFELDGLPVRWAPLKWPQYHGAGGPQDVDDMGAFVERRTPISEEEFDEMVRERRRLRARATTPKKGSLSDLLRRRAAEDPAFRRGLLDALRGRNEDC